MTGRDTAVLADVADAVPETAEPKICQCGKHYTTNPDWHTSRACDECGADTTEPCRPYCTADATHNDNIDTKGV